MSPCGAAACDLAQVLTSDDTRVGRRGRDEPPRPPHPPLAAPREFILASRLAGSSSTPASYQTWKSLLSPLTAAYSTSEHTTALHLILKRVINTNCCTTIAQKTCWVFFFFLSFFLSSEPRRKWGWYGDSAAITHSLIERQRLDTLSASGLKRESRAWLPDWMGL